MISIICGSPGVGKTALATALAIGNMLDDVAEQAVKDSKLLLKDLKLTGFPKFKVPKDHLVYSDYSIRANIDGTIVSTSKEVDGFRIGLYEPDWETLLIPPRATIVLDEAQIYYDSKRSSRLPEFVTRFYAMHRHNYYSINLVSQRPVSIDKSIRSLSEQFIHIVKMSNTYDAFGDIVMTTWDCVEFDNTTSAERYSDTREIDVNGKRTKYEYYGNIFDCYDSHGKFALYYNGREEQAFSNTESKFMSWNGEDIKAYNKTHKITTPDIFLKQKRKSKEELEEVV